MFPPGKLHQRIAFGTGEIEYYPGESSACNTCGYYLPRSNSGIYQEQRAEYYKERGCFAHRAWYKPEENIGKRILRTSLYRHRHGSVFHKLAYYRFARHAVHRTCAVNPYFASRHVRRIREKCECAGQQSRIPHVHARAAEYFLAYYHCERSGEADHPQRHGNRHYYGYQHARYEKTFLDVATFQV